MKRNAILIIILSILIIVLLSGCANIQKSPSITLVYNNPSIYDKPYTKSESDIGLSLVELINEETTSIYFAIYGVRNQPDIADALL